MFTMDFGVDALSLSTAELDLNGRCTTSHQDDRQDSQVGHKRPINPFTVT